MSFLLSPASWVFLRNKTSLVNRLVHNTFGKEKKTEGIKITG
jgi:hypothetical protein